MIRDKRNLQCRGKLPNAPMKSSSSLGIAGGTSISWCVMLGPAKGPRGCSGGFDVSVLSTSNGCGTSETSACNLRRAPSNCLTRSRRPSTFFCSSSASAKASLLVMSYPKALRKGAYMHLFDRFPVVKAPELRCECHRLCTRCYPPSGQIAEQPLLTHVSQGTYNTQESAYSQLTRCT